MCQDLANTQNNTRFAIVRFGNVRSSGSVVPLFKQQIASAALNINASRCDTLLYDNPEAAQLVIQAGSLARVEHLRFGYGQAIEDTRTC